MTLTRVYTDLPVPEFYRERNAERWDYHPDQQAVFDAAIAWREQFAFTPASEDDIRVHLLLVDLQKDFCFREGRLYVGGRSGEGALLDNDRTARFIYGALNVITQITCTMDTHYPHQIFSPSFWLTSDGTPPHPHREVTSDDVRSGRLRPNPALAPYLTAGNYERLWRQAVFYCEELEKSGRYTLYLWPPHCLLGSDGHSLAGVVHEARLFHAYARVSPSTIELKGDNPLTENYS
ncbi:MAG: nicotinamidase, partial [Longimicrobiales bacterium]